MKSSVTAHPAQIDGRIQSGEYSCSDKRGFSDGMCLVYDAGKSLDPNNQTAVLRAEDFTQSTYSSYDDEFFYFGFELFFPEKMPAPTVHPDFGKVYSFSVSIGLNDTENPLERFAYFSNTYLFSKQSFSCVEVSGMRMLPSAQGAPEITKRISSTLPRYLMEGITLADGTLCNGEYYTKNVVSQMRSHSEGEIFTIEIRLPAEDVLSCVSKDNLPSVKEALFDQNGVLCGSFISEFYLKHSSCDSLRIATGIPAQTERKGSVPSQSWKEFLILEDPAEKRDLEAVEILPIPIWFAGNPEPVQPSFLELAAKPSVSSSGSEKPANEGNNPYFENETQSSSEGEVLPEDESVFDSLPSEDSFVPEDVLQVDVSQEGDEQEEKTVRSVLSSILLIAGGGCLLGSAFLSLLFLRKWEKKEEKPKKSSK